MSPLAPSMKTSEIDNLLCKNELYVNGITWKKTARKDYSAAVFETEVHNELVCLYLMSNCKKNSEDECFVSHLGSKTLEMPR